MLVEMQHRGVCVDLATLLHSTELLAQCLQFFEQEAQRLAKTDAPFNLLSPQQVRHVLFEHLQLDAGIALDCTRETREKSTSEASLRRLGADHPLPKLVERFLEGG